MLFTFADVNFLYFCLFLFLVSIAIMVSVSLFTREPSYDRIQGLTYATTVVEDKEASRSTWKTRDVILSLVVLVIIALIMVYFSPLVLAR